MRAALDEINPITGAVIDAHFRNTFAHRPYITGVAVTQPEDPHLHPCSRAGIAQRPKPGGEFLRFADFDHGQSVIYGSHQCNSGGLLRYIVEQHTPEPLASKGLDLKAPHRRVAEVDGHHALREPEHFYEVQFDTRIGPPRGQNAVLWRSNFNVSDG